MTATERGRTPGTSRLQRLLYSGGARLLSLLLAGGLSGLILLAPGVVAAGGVDHGWLTLLMWGIAAGFVHGVGYVPLHRIWRWLLGPVAGWALMLGIGGLLVSAG